MLSETEAEKLIDLLDNDSDPLDEIYQNLCEFDQTSTRIIALSSLSQLLINQLLNHNQQFIAAWLLYREYSALPISQNPFYQTFVFISEIRIQHPNIYSPLLNDFIGFIFSNSTDKLYGPTSLKDLPQTVVVILNSASQPKIGDFYIKNSFSHILSERRTDEPITHSPRDVLKEVLVSGILLDDWVPPMIRPSIQIYRPVDNYEFKDNFIGSFGLPDMVYDTSIQPNTKRGAVKYLEYAKTQRLKEVEMQGVLSTLQSDPTILTSQQFTDDDIRKIVSNNPDIAKVYLDAVWDSRDQIEDLVASLEFSVSSIDVIRHLAAKHGIQSKFVLSFISNSLTQIQVTSDNALKASLSRLFCKFMNCMLDEKLEIERDMILELHSFCIDSSQKGIEEAKKLLDAMFVR